MDKDLQNRIWLTRYLMVIGIVVLHTPPYQPLTELSLSTFDFIKAFFSHALFRTTVPVLAAISAYLLFRSNLVNKPINLLKKKSTSILLPLILWNVPVALAIYVAQRYELLPHAFSDQLYPFAPMAWLDAITGLTTSPANYPLNFLRDLFVLSVLAPLFLPLLKYAPYGGLLVIGLVYFYNLDGPLVLRNSMIISFYIGALAATQKWRLTTLDPFAWPLLALLIMLCSAVVIWDIQNREWLRIISPFMIWPVMSLLCNTPIATFLLRHADASFLTFLAHAPMLIVLWILFQQIGGTLPYPVFWVGAPIIIAVICAMLHPLLYRVMPGVSKVLLGGR